MGQKIHPIGFRIGVNRGWDSHWFFDNKSYSQAVKLDYHIREFIKKSLGKGIISHIEIERAINRIKVTIFTSRPGAVIGRGGKGIDELTEKLNKLVQKLEPSCITQVNVTEVRQPDLDSPLVAENIAISLEKRVPHKRAMRQAMNRSIRMGARGIKVQISGKLGNSEIARTETDKMGKIPLHTLRADIDYAVAPAFTLKGAIGVKVWIYKGEILPDKQRLMIAEASPRRERGDREERGDRRDRRDRGDRGDRRSNNPSRHTQSVPSSNLESIPTNNMEVTQNVNA